VAAPFTVAVKGCPTPKLKIVRSVPSVSDVDPPDQAVNCNRRQDLRPFTLLDGNRHGHR
jgi:hypothetical protein